MGVLRQFKTRRFVVELSWDYEQYPDLSWADSETMNNIQRGIWGVFDFKVAVYLDGDEIAADYLGNNIYADPAEFAREHFGMRPKGYSCYFSDMVRQAIYEARDHCRRTMPYIRPNANT